MDTLPPYEAPSNHSAGVASTSSQHTTGDSAGSIGQVSLPAANSVTLEVAAEGIIGGSGVRLPLSARERVNFDRRICTTLRTFGPYVRTSTTPYRGMKAQTETFCPPEHIYQSAASQLDVLLPALSNGTLPSTTALRTITLRLDLPTPDAVWISESLRTGPVKGRETLCRAYKSWLVAFQPKKLELGLLEMAESIAGRLAFEGFLLLEEWWDPRRGLLMLTVRC
ncbi:unnamed protein product [Rhizoctonia solani]|uniref:Uncharacterized protein n=1 Tax=Rhizoctonia solani TaxID=456999 RepID=A0A8H3BRG6_9AGAM|nr:unnamed protein product [Rhizoctonia solani]CAE6462505.1 unnamed protein product [Rhizoctonia solani]